MNELPSDVKPTGVKPANPVAKFESWQSFQWPTWGHFFTLIAIMAMAFIVAAVSDHWETLKYAAWSPLVLAASALDWWRERSFLDQSAFVGCLFLWRIAVHAKRISAHLASIRNHFNI